MKQAALVIALIVATTARTWADQIPSFQPLGVLPDYLWSGAGDVTPDGAVVVGACSSYTASEAFRWTPAGGLVGLGDLPGGEHRSIARGVSADGNVIVGYGTVEYGHPHAFRWTPDGGMEDLGTFPEGPRESEATGISADGRVIVGHSRRELYSEAYRWTAAEGMVGIGTLPGYLSSWAQAISANATTIVGSGDDGDGSRQAFRWTADDGIVGLGDLPGGTWPFESAALAVSDDGSFVVGRAESALGREAFRWSDEEGMIALGDLPGGDHDSSAFGVTSDGTIVAGRATTDWGDEAFLWDQQHGMRRLQDVLQDVYGLDLSGWRLVAAGISDDGNMIIGKGMNPSGYAEAFLARIPEPGALGLMIIGALVIGLAGRRRK